MLKELPSWWAAQMRELVPSFLRERGEGQADAVIAEFGMAADEPMLELLDRRNRRETRIGRFGAVGAAAADNIRQALSRHADVAAVFLRLPASLVLDREMTLPLAAERDLGRVLQFEMDRITPFAAHEIFSSFEVERRDRARNRLSVRLRIVPRMPIDPVIATLAQAGHRPVSIEVKDAPLARPIPLSQDAKRRDWAWQGVIVLASLCGVLSVAAIVIPFIRQEQQLHSVERTIASLRPAVAQAEQLRRRIAAAAASVNVIASERARVGDGLATLAAVTDILPDDTSLNELTLAQRKLGLQGQSAGAARLIAALAADPSFKNPSFTAPVVRNEAGGSDTFSIQAEVLP